VIAPVAVGSSRLAVGSSSRAVGSAAALVRGLRSEPAPVPRTSRGNPPRRALFADFGFAPAAK
jgi:hypothetical protein